MMEVRFEEQAKEKCLRSLLRRLNSLSIDEGILQEAEAIIRKIVDKTNGSYLGTPSGMVAFAVWAASQRIGRPLTQKQVARLLNVTDVTIRSIRRKVEKILGDIT